MNDRLWLPPDTLNRGYVERQDDWSEESLPAHVAQLLEPGTRRYSNGDALVLVSRDPYTQQWHMSISHPDRDPSWEEITTARYALIPDGVYMVQVLPPRAHYTNVHKHCFHLYEVDADERWGEGVNEQ